MLFCYFRRCYYCRCCGFWLMCFGWAGCSLVWPHQPLSETVVSLLQHSSGKLSDPRQRRMLLLFLACLLSVRLEVWCRYLLCAPVFAFAAAVLQACLCCTCTGGRSSRSALRCSKISCPALLPVVSSAQTWRLVALTLWCNSRGPGGARDRDRDHNPYQGKAKGLLLWTSWCSLTVQTA